MGDTRANMRQTAMYNQRRRPVSPKQSNKMTSPSDPTATDKRDFVTRYFLRRLAIARHKSPPRTLGTQYTDALLETILIFVSMPMVSALSVVVILSLRWAPNTVAKWFGFSPWGGVAVIGILSVSVGHLWIGRRFKKCREDRSIYTQFASEKDSRIVAWQRFIVFVVGGIVLPFLAMYITFGNQVITRAFELR
jgi:hypothetical protein